MKGIKPKELYSIEMKGLWIKLRGLKENKTTSCKIGNPISDKYRVSVVSLSLTLIKKCYKNLHQHLGAPLLTRG